MEYIFVCQIIIIIRIKHNLITKYKNIVWMKLDLSNNMSLLLFTNNEVNLVFIYTSFVKLFEKW